MTTIKMKDVLPSLTTAVAIGHRNLTLVPLRGEGHQHRFQDYMLAAEAINAGLLTVTEVDESGSVPELLAVNDADDADSRLPASGETVRNNTAKTFSKRKWAILSAIQLGGIDFRRRRLFRIGRNFRRWRETGRL